MKCVVLAAGEGTRMRPLTATRPKPLLPVAGRPLLEHVFDAAAPVADEYVVVVGYGADAVREAIGSAYRDRPVTYVDQPEAAGTGDAVERAVAAMAPLEDRFLVCNGDLLLPPDPVERVADATGTAMVVAPVADPTAFGVVSLDGARVVDVVEKPADPPTDLANVGCYAFAPSIADHLDGIGTSQRGERELTDAVAAAADAEGVTAVRHDGDWFDVGRPWDLLDATAWVLDDLDAARAGTLSPDATVEGPVAIGDGATVRPGTVVEGPVRIGPEASIGPNAYVRGPTAIGAGAHVGHAVEVKASVLMAGATAGHLSYVGDSVLGRDVNLGAGTVVANLRHDGASVRMRVKGEPVDTGRRKLGCVLGDGAKTGIDTSLDVGTTLDAGATTVPGAVVSGEGGS